jgi:hypothetical protein
MVVCTAVVATGYLKYFGHKLSSYMSISGLMLLHYIPTSSRPIAIFY